MVIPSSVDPTLAPPGAHVCLLFTQYTPYTLSGGRAWDEATKEAYADIVRTVMTLPMVCALSRWEGLRVAVIPQAMLAGAPRAPSRATHASTAVGERPDERQTSVGVDGGSRVEAGWLRRLNGSPHLCFCLAEPRSSHTNKTIMEKSSKQRPQYPGREGLIISGDPASGVMERGSAGGRVTCNPVGAVVDQAASAGMATGDIFPPGKRFGYERRSKKSSQRSAMELSVPPWSQSVKMETKRDEWSRQDRSQPELRRSDTNSSRFGSDPRGESGSSSRKRSRSRERKRSRSGNRSGVSPRRDSGRHGGGSSAKTSQESRRFREAANQERHPDDNPRAEFREGRGKDVSRHSRGDSRPSRSHNIGRQVRDSPPLFEQEVVKPDIKVKVDVGESQHKAESVWDRLEPLRSRDTTRGRRESRSRSEVLPKEEPGWSSRRERSRSPVRRRRSRWDTPKEVPNIEEPMPEQNWGDVSSGVVDSSDFGPRGFSRTRGAEGPPVGRESPPRGGGAWGDPRGRGRGKGNFPRGNEDLKLQGRDRDIPGSMGHRGSPPRIPGPRHDRNNPPSERGWRGPESSQGSGNPSVEDPWIGPMQDERRGSPPRGEHWSGPGPNVGSPPRKRAWSGHGASQGRRSPPRSRGENWGEPGQSRNSPLRERDWSGPMPGHGRGSPPPDWSGPEPRPGRGIPPRGPDSKHERGSPPRAEDWGGPMLRRERGSPQRGPGPIGSPPRGEEWGGPMERHGRGSPPRDPGPRLGRGSPPRGEDWGGPIPRHRRGSPSRGPGPQLERGSPPRGEEWGVPAPRHGRGSPPREGVWRGPGAGEGRGSPPREDLWSGPKLQEDRSSLPREEYWSGSGPNPSGNIGPRHGRGSPHRGRDWSGPGPRHGRGSPPRDLGPRHGRDSPPRDPGPRHGRGSPPRDPGPRHGRGSPPRDPGPRHGRGSPPRDLGPRHDRVSPPREENWSGPMPRHGRDHLPREGEWAGPGPHGDLARDHPPQDDLWRGPGPREHRYSPPRERDWSGSGPKHGRGSPPREGDWIGPGPSHGRGSPPRDRWRDQGRSSPPREGNWGSPRSRHGRGSPPRERDWIGPGPSRGRSPPRDDMWRGVGPRENSPGLDWDPPMDGRDWYNPEGGRSREGSGNSVFEYQGSDPGTSQAGMQPDWQENKETRDWEDSPNCGEWGDSLMRFADKHGEPLESNRLNKSLFNHDLQVAVVAEINGKVERLTKSDGIVIRRALMNSVKEAMANVPGLELRFLKSGVLGQGWFLITCANKQTRDWLLSWTPPEVYGIQLTVRTRDEMTYLQKATIGFWLKSNERFVDKVLDSLQAQNGLLDTSQWTFLQKKENKNSWFWTFLIDAVSLKALNSHYHWNLCHELRTVKVFRILKKGKRGFRGQTHPRRPV